MQRKGVTIWLTGLSGAGKSTLAEGLAHSLQARGRSVEILDGDVVRTHLSKGLGFSREDRETNIRRIAFICDLLTRNGVVCISAAISPYRESRQWARQTIGNFVEVYVKCPIDVCRQRDVKGLYKLVDEGRIKQFTGVDDPYEEPEAPELVVKTDHEAVEESVARILATMTTLGYLDPESAHEDEVGATAEPPLAVSSGESDTDEGGTHAITDGLIAPHGGALVVNLADEAERAAWLEELESARTLRRHVGYNGHRERQESRSGLRELVVGPRHIADLEMLAVGAYSPLTGFMSRSDYLSVVNEMHLHNGLPWSIPVTLAVDAAAAAGLKEGAQVALVDAQGSHQAIMTIEEIYPYDKQQEASQVYRTLDDRHPGVNSLYKQGDLLLSGPVRVIGSPGQAFAQYRHTPAQARALFTERGWKQVVGFQTRNPVHRAHEYIQKCALEIVDGLYLHPLVGETKSDDVPADVRMRCYEVLLEHYYPAERIVLGVLPAAMRYAGPREAVFHALIRKNYGCSHFIVGRDHAGVGHYYGPYDAHRIFAQFDPAKLGITPLFFDQTFFCRVCDSMASSKTCSHGREHHVTLSGTQVRQMLQAGQLPPREFSRPEVAQVLMAVMQSRAAAL